MRVLGAIVAGGQSLRMGQEKAFVQLGGIALIERVLSRLSIQTDDVVINANGDHARFQHLHVPVIADRLANLGTPLAGIEAIFHYAAQLQFDAVLTVPSDAPFLPLDLSLVLQGAGKGSPIIAASAEQSHYLTGFWPASCYAVLPDAIAQRGLTRVQDFVRLVNAKELVWPDALLDPFLNINTPQDLSFAEAVLSV